MCKNREIYSWSCKARNLALCETWLLFDESFESTYSKMFLWDYNNHLSKLTVEDIIILYVTKYQLKYELLILHFSTNSPDALELKCIEVWLISCTIFVFLALMEYFVVLFGIRYDKSWSRRRADLRRAASAAQLAPPPLHINHSQVRS